MPGKQELATRPLSENIGIEIAGADVRDIGGSIALGEIERRLFDGQLLCFREQSLTPDDLMAFTCRFGEPLPHVLQQFALPGYPDIYVLSNLVENGRPIGNRREGFGWHTDLTYMAVPPAYTILYAIEVPQNGGDTRFASLYKAWSSLDEATRNALRGLRTIHSYPHLYGKRTGVEPLTEAQRAQTPDVTQPAVRIHPHTGREGMYLNPGDCIGVEGLDGVQAEAKLALIAQLYDYTIGNFAYSHRWRSGDLLIWDNRGALHTATDYDTENDRRLVWRTSVVGEVPIGWQPG